MTATITEYRLADTAAAATSLADALARRLADAIAMRGTALIALSGGRSPAPVLRQLSSVAFDWSRVTVVQVDERWVPADHDDSNQRLIEANLLHGPAAAARFLPMFNGAADPEGGQPAYEAALAALPRPFDVVLLGMGEDGHIASLFPGAAELTEGLTTAALCLAVTPPAAPHPRLSLSLAGLLDSRLIAIQIGGAAKEAVYREALGAGPAEAMPIRAVLRQTRVPVETWIAG